MGGPDFNCDTKNVIRNVTFGQMSLLATFGHFGDIWDYGGLAKRGLRCPLDRPFRGRVLTPECHFWPNVTFGHFWSFCVFWDIFGGPKSHFLVILAILAILAILEISGIMVSGAPYYSLIGGGSKPGNVSFGHLATFGHLAKNDHFDHFRGLR